MLDFGFNNETSNNDFGKHFFESLISAGLKELNLDQQNIGLSLNLISPDKIKKLNKEYRQKDVATDVLSFPIHDSIPSLGLRTKDELSILELGDIFISPVVAYKKAETENKSVSDELAFLTVHGLLHLCGYDHEKSEQESKKMFSLQDRILSATHTKF